MSNWNQTACPNHRGAGLPTAKQPLRSFPCFRAQDVRAQACAAGLIALAAQGLAHAAEIRGQLFDHQPKRAWLEKYDPTLISSRLVGEFSYESYDDDGDYWKLENTLRWAIPLRDGLALGMQVMVPLKWTETATDDAFGMGDLELRTGIVGRLAPTLRYAFALNAVVETATDSLLSDNAFVLRPITAIRWDASDRVNLGLNIEYNFTPLDEDAKDVSALELKFPLAFKINDDWSGFLSYNPKWNLLAETDRHRLELGATRIWGSDKQYALSIGTEVPLASESFEFKLASGFAWYF